MQPNPWCHADLIIFTEEHHNENLQFLSSIVLSRYLLLRSIDHKLVCYHLYNLKNMKNTHDGVSLLVKFQAEVCNFTVSNTPLWIYGCFSRF